MKTITASDRSTLIRLASSLPVGDETRTAILNGLAQIRHAGPYNPRPPWPDDPGGQGKPGKKNVYNLHNEYDTLEDTLGAKPGTKKYRSEYMKKWREEWQGKHTDRKEKSPDGYGGHFNPGNSDDK